MIRRLYRCETCLGEQRLTFAELVLATSTKPLRCAVATCNGFAYLAASETNAAYLRNLNRSSGSDDPRLAFDR